MELEVLTLETGEMRGAGEDLRGSRPRQGDGCVLVGLRVLHFPQSENPGVNAPLFINPGVFKHLFSQWEFV